MRRRVPALCPQWPGHASANDDSAGRWCHRRGALPAARTGACRDAVELSVLAGGAFPRADHPCRQRRVVEARQRRPGRRRADRRDGRRRRRPRWLVPEPRDQVVGGRRDHRRRTHRRGDADRQRGRWPRRRRTGGQGAEEGRPRTRRIGPVHRHAVRRHRYRGQAGRRGAHPEYRPVVHLRQAHDRPRRHL